MHNHGLNESEDTQIKEKDLVVVITEMGDEEKQLKQTSEANGITQKDVSHGEDIEDATIKLTPINQGEKTNYGSGKIETTTTRDEFLALILKKIRHTKKETSQVAKHVNKERELTASPEELQTKEAKNIQIKGAKTGEEKDEKEEGEEHKKTDLSSEALVVVDVLRDMDVKFAHKKSHGILSCVGSKVKHSISKVKKAITVVRIEVGPTAHSVRIKVDDLDDDDHDHDQGTLRDLIVFTNSDSDELLEAVDIDNSSDEVVGQINKTSKGSGHPSGTSLGTNMAVVTVKEIYTANLRRISIILSRVITLVASSTRQVSASKVVAVNKEVLPQARTHDEEMKKAYKERIKQRKVTEDALRRTLASAETKASMAIENLKELSLTSGQLEVGIAKPELRCTV
ncbi:hypothetical protein Ddye_028981 [Dipteronia dyeriana]|uniref:Uncharacterized protein n=1 Tax=Dipteronia dyeriana TaxID=168575 RepID=A0AAD9TEQ5_9ROSI|nr:hypothetical protein Ddye_028981 [Dipteronia dyeriana]